MGDIGMLAMGIAVIAAVIAVGRKTRLRRQGGEHHELGPFQVHSFDAIDDTVRRTRCECGSPLELQGEGTIRRDGQEFRIARCLCVQCDATLTLTFDLSGLHH